MICVIAVLLLGLSLDSAKTCKPVNYKFKQQKATLYGYGCKKGCFSFSSDPNDPAVNITGEGASAHTEQKKCGECAEIKVVESLMDEEAAMNFCNQLKTCVWKGGKCKASSCPIMRQRSKCIGQEDFGWEWTKDGKCKKTKGDGCVVKSWSARNANNSQISTSSTIYKSDNPSGNSDVVGADPDNPDETVSCKSLTSYFYINNGGVPGGSGFGGPPAATYAKYSDDDAKRCQYRCEHPERDFYYPAQQYSKAERKECHKELGCMFANSDYECSYLAVWAFILILVLSIVVFLAIVAVIVIVVLKLGKKKAPVDPNPAPRTNTQQAQPVPEQQPDVAPTEKAAEEIAPEQQTDAAVTATAAPAPAPVEAEESESG